MAAALNARVKRRARQSGFSTDASSSRTSRAASADGKVITNVGIRTDPLTGETNKLRIVTTIADRDHYTVEWFMTGKDGKEEKTVTMIHTRRR